jgi:RNA polymerase sigma-70 factor (ECF subfamily)
MAKIENIALLRDENAFRHLVLTFAPKVKALMIRRGADAETAEEIAQETMIAVWRKGHLFAAEKGSISTWIYTIARNLSIDRARRKVPIVAAGEGWEDLPSDEELADTRIVRQQDEATLSAALAALPEEQREVIELAFIDGLSHSKIAKKLSLPLGTVKSRVRLAYRRLRDEVEGNA